MDQGLAALAGAGIGGTAAAAAAVIAARAIRHQAQNQVQLWRSQTRREVYLAFHIAIECAVDEAWAVQGQATRVLHDAELRGREQALQQIAQNQAPERREERNKINQRLTELHGLYVTLEFEGPASVREVAGDLLTEVKHYIFQCLRVAVPDTGEPPAPERATKISADLQSSLQRIPKLYDRFLRESARVLDGKATPRWRRVARSARRFVSR
ncbi:hypothetical protein ABT039_22210 [Streptomyces lasiicapitis]|uniref:hypothetical protein n=1 Tax=Streptomyces lasiicapitis TaxID=1923961 RepID=UPI0033247F3C